MKKLIVLLLLSLLLSSCGGEPQPVREQVPSMSDSSSEAPPVPSITPPEIGEDEDDPSVYKPEGDMTMEEIVEAYFEQQYLSYTNLIDIDLSAIIDMRSVANQNMVNWMKMLTMRRKLIIENGFCYVETEQFPYTIWFEDEAEDQRMQIWEKRLEDLEMTAVHFRIEGEAGEVYPPIMALNSQHSMLFRRVDGLWKISMHYFPGSRRKYGIGTVTVPTEKEMLEELELEFAAQTPSEPLKIPAGGRVYDAKAAVAYAEAYTEVKNPDFYDIGDWTGNCANFVSQAVWTGFGADRMTSEWYDGAPAWNHVGYFWDYITDGGALGGQELEGVSELEDGDIIQTRSLSMTDEPDRFTHELIVVDIKTLKLAQNTPAAFVYYSDLVNIQTRMIRPVYIR